MGGGRSPSGMPQTGVALSNGGSRFRFYVNFKGFMPCITPFPGVTFIYFFKFQGTITDLATRGSLYSIRSAPHLQYLLNKKYARLSKLFNRSSIYTVCTLGTEYLPTFIRYCSKRCPFFSFQSFLDGHRCFPPLFSHFCPWAAVNVSKPSARTGLQDS